jgi:hypothetical protein
MTAVMTLLSTSKKQCDRFLRPGSGARGRARPPTLLRGRMPAYSADDAHSDAGRFDDGRSSASTMDPLDGVAGCPVGPPDPLLEHDPLHNSLDARQHHTLLKNPGSLSFSQDGAQMSTVSKCYRLINSVLLFLSSVYDNLPADAQESAADLQAEAMDTQESLCFVLDEYVLRSKHTREQAKTFIDGVRFLSFPGSFFNAVHRGTLPLASPGTLHQWFLQGWHVLLQLVLRRRKNWEEEEEEEEFFKALSC